MSFSSLGLQVPSEKVFGVGARRVQRPSEEVLRGVGFDSHVVLEPSIAASKMKQDESRGFRDKFH